MTVDHGKQPLIGAIRHAGGELEARIHPRLFSIFEQPNRAWIGRLLSVAGNVKSTIRPRENRVAAQPSQHQAGGTAGVIAHDLATLLRDGVEVAIRAKRHAMGGARLRDELLHFSIEVNAVNFIFRGVREKDFAARIARRAPRTFKPLRHQLPRLIWPQDILRPRPTRAGLHPLGPTFPKVGHRLLVVLQIPSYVATIDNPELVIVAGKFQRFGHLLIDEEPIPGTILHIAGRGRQK